MLRSDGSFEIREHPAQTVASTKRGGEDEGLRRLFRAKENISLPVTEQINGGRRNGWGVHPN